MRFIWFCAATSSLLIAGWQPVHGAEGQWNGGDGNWHEQVNWTGAVPASPGDEALIEQPVTAEWALQLDAAAALGSLQVLSLGDVRLSGSTLTMDSVSGPGATITLDGPGVVWFANPLVLADDTSFSVAPATTLRLDRSIGGSGDLNISGGGTIEFGPSFLGTTYGGQIDLDAGLLRILGPANRKPLGTAAGGTSVGPGATLDVSGIAVSSSTVFSSSFLSEDLTLAGHGVLGPDGERLGALHFDHIWRGFVTGDIQLAEDTTIYQTGNGALHLGYTTGTGGAITGTGRLIKTGGSVHGFGKVQINTQAGHTGGTLVREGIVEVGSTGSLVGTGGVQVDRAGQLSIREGAGLHPTTSSVEAQSVRLNGGHLGLLADLDPTQYISPLSSSGAILFGADNTHDLNLSTLLGGTDDGDRVRLGATATSVADPMRRYTGTIRFAPDAADRVVRIGAGNGRLDLAGDLLSSNHVEAVEVRTQYGAMLSGQNTYTGQTRVERGLLIASGPGSLGSATGTLADATVVGPAGTLALQPDAPTTELVVLEGGALRGAVNTPVLLASGTRSRIVGGFINSNISGGGDLTLVAGQIGGNNTYTGHTLIIGQSDSVVRIASASALGAASTGTTMSGGVLQLAVDVAEPLVIEDGALELQTPTFSGNLTLRGGSVRAWNQAATINSPVTLAGGLNAMGGNGSSTPLTVIGEIGGEGDLVGVDDLILEGPLTFDGRLISNRGTIVLRTSELPDEIVVDSGFAGGVRMEADATARFLMRGGQLTIPDAYTVTSVDPVLVMDGGTLDGRLQGLQKIVIDGGGFLRSLGADNDIAIEVAQGVLSASTADALGSPDTPTIITAKHGAGIAIGGKITEDIDLNNARGPVASGALQGAGEYAGHLHLGDEGSTIHVSDRMSLQLTGRVTGGSLDLVGDRNGRSGTLAIRTDMEHIGATRVLAGTVSIDGDGRLASTSEIVLERGKLQTIRGNHPDGRIGDDVAIRLAGGELSVDSQVLTERFGELEARRGVSRILGSAIADRLVRSNRAVLEISGETRLQFDEAPALTGGIIGGWIVNFAEADFVAYQPGVGTVRLDEQGRPATLLGAQPGDNVSLTAGQHTLDHDATINSLRLAGSLADGGADVDLGGHQLQIATGGIITTHHAGSINNGQITAEGELFLHSPRTSSAPGITIGADLIDPQGQSMGLTVNEGWWTLSGSNTFSGGTVVHDGRLVLASSGALPEGSDLTMHAGTIDVAVAGPSPLSLGEIRMYGGTISGQSLAATSVFAEAGSIVNLVGEAPILKEGDGTLYVTLTSAYAGDVDVRGGTLAAGLPFGATDAGFGSGLVTVREGASLLLNAERGTHKGNVRLDGGTIAASFGTRSNPTGLQDAVTVTSDGVLDFRGSGARVARLTLEDGVSLASVGGAQLRIDEQVLVNGDATIHIDNGQLVIDAPFVAGQPDSSLAFTSHPDWALRYPDLSAITLGGNRSAYTGDIVLSGIVAETTTSTALGAGLVTITDGASLEVGAASTAGNILLDNGSLTFAEGASFVGTLINGGVLSPGASPGVLSIAGDLTQAADGVLLMELADPVLAAELFPRQADLLEVTKKLTLDGTLRIDLLHGYMPLLGDEFQLLQFGELAGEFAELQLPELAGSRQWDTSDLYATGVLRVVPEPGTIALLGAVAAWVLPRRRTAGGRF